MEIHFSASQGLDEYTSKAVDATGKAVQYTAQKASESRVTEKVFEVTEKAASASYEYTKKAIDLTVDGTKKVVDVTGKAVRFPVPIFSSKRQTFVPAHTTVSTCSPLHGRAHCQPGAVANRR